MNLRTIALVATVGLGLASPAAAEPRTVQTVAFADLDLTSGTGRAMLDARLARAARAVCGAKVAGDAIGNGQIDECRVDALARAHRDAVRMARTSDVVRVAALISK